MAVSTCPACQSADIRDYPASRRTGRVNFRCHECGLVGWKLRDELVVPETASTDEISIDSQEEWYANKRADVIEKALHEVIDEVATMVGGAEGRSLYDIGAGDGHFLAAAREHGFAVRGNEVMEAAVKIAATTNNVDLDLGDISVLDLPKQDVVTLWCVIAHVDQPQRLIENTFDLLKPGGVLYLQTPHLCTADRVAMAGLRASGGRISRWTDRRVAQHHWMLHTPESIERSLTRAGFVDVKVKPRARFSLAAEPYLLSLGVKPGAARRGGRVIDTLLDREIAPRITLDVYARRPRD